MATAPPVYTINQANELMPQVRAVLLQLAVERRRPQRDMAEGREAVRGLFGVLEGMGIQLRDLEMGLVDFPAERDGRRVWLCWQLSDPAVAFWHGTNEGYATRRPW